MDLEIILGVRGGGLQKGITNTSWDVGGSSVVFANNGYDAGSLLSGPASRAVSVPTFSHFLCGLVPYAEST